VGKHDEWNQRLTAQLAGSLPEARGSMTATTIEGSLGAPCRLAVSETSRGPARLSKTILAFSSSDQRPRRPLSTISSRPKALRVRLSIRTVLSATNTAPQGGPHRKLTSWKPNSLLNWDAAGWQSSCRTASLRPTS
jgi:hypothetical protein